MKITVLSDKDNPLIQRREVVFAVDHTKEGLTPSRLELRKKLAELLKTKMELVYVEEVKTKTGEPISLGQVNAYKSPERAELVERRHIILRNTPPKTPEKQEKPIETEPSEESEEESKEERTQEESNGVDEKTEEKKPSDSESDGSE
ncbi:MAG: hypothetical protein JSV35_07115 [Candidatus Bathyarchaeota archaeon]|nr:MAG: hypothetical protein JSV35_07115 [Candidatus Bathyarchaeota archaeon]